jgi:non-specific serine/threonine protein kinase/serine/threonine-protein kinase
MPEPHETRTVTAANGAGEVATGNVSTGLDDAARLELLLHNQPEHVGPYKILEVIGEGGMGVVYKAEQREPIRRTVALKLIKLGMDTKEVIARFEAERQALAVMDHPGIAKVHDAGATEQGRPYFVMEYVAGEPITGYCDKHNLTVRQRLELFARVCEAVQHAHTKGIIHRDLKPTNVLVTLHDGRPLPKVIDFGIAKATQQRLTERTLFTETGRMIGTPEYMSPEQAEMSGLDVDTRTDIYSLGVLLYELLTGALPFDPKTLRAAAYGEVQRMIREVDPPRPSTRLSGLGHTAADVARRRQTRIEDLARQLKRELEWIPLKAMRKDRALRYGTAREFASDIENYLLHRPLVAGPESAAYRVKKFLKRRRAVVISVAAVLVALALGVTATTGALVARARALQELRNVRAEANRFQFIPPNKAQAELTVAELGSVELGATGWDLRNRGQFEEAESVFRRAYRLSARVLGESDLDTLSHLNRWGLVLLDLGRTSEAEAALRRAYEGQRQVLGPEHPDVIQAMDGYAFALLKGERLKEAEEILRSELEVSERVLPADDPGIFFTLDNLAHVLYAQDRFADAEPFVRRAREGRRRLLGERHRDTLVSTNNLAEVLEYQGKNAEAEALYVAALAGKRAVFGDGHIETLTTMCNLTRLLASMSRFEDAVEIGAELHRRAAEAAGDPARLAEFMAYYGLCLAKLERYADALGPLRAARERFRLVPEPHSERVKGFEAALDAALTKAAAKHATPAASQP